ncbi:winged helix-turn-helix transcriptional regulator [Actinomadura graeca]|uniref:Winged helix-turn-helix transcriptional regulator n=1 Tax=Actinomadura graeca TaxID=2750812 RepID=A0ABX8QQC1_9ACTN|nr:winged helix-turn-helix domain-containing protein [Actinomadura graeca]QXJ20621.1 winged helix-turn-helix transcriptional regulator [Actinomadura graeca]
MSSRAPRGTYLRLTDALRKRLKDGTYAPGSRLPSEAALCAEFNVARNTVRRALAALEAEGLMMVRTGLGRFAHGPTTQPIPRPRTQRERITANLRQEIETGSLRPGDALPSESQLSRHYDVSRFTARTALIALEAADLVTCVPGKGRFVRQDVPR